VDRSLGLVSALVLVYVFLFAPVVPMHYAGHSPVVQYAPCGATRLELGFSGQGCDSVLVSVGWYLTQNGLSANAGTLVRAGRSCDCVFEQDNCSCG
jgi:hypothetical protein